MNDLLVSIVSGPHSVQAGRLEPAPGTGRRQMRPCRGGITQTNVMANITMHNQSLSASIIHKEALVKQPGWAGGLVDYRDMMTVRVLSQSICGVGAVPHNYGESEFSY